MLSLKKETTQHCFSYLQNALKYLKFLMTYPLNTIFDDFGNWYRIEFNCLYIPHGHYFISTLWLLSTDNYVNFERKYTFNLFMHMNTPITDKRAVDFTRT